MARRPRGRSLRGKESEMHGADAVSLEKAVRRHAGAVHQTESCITADKGMKPLLIAGRGVFCCPQSCAGEGTKAHQGHFQGQAPDRGAFSLSRTVVTKIF